MRIFTANTEPGPAGPASSAAHTPPTDPHHQHPNRKPAHPRKHPSSSVRSRRPPEAPLTLTLTFSTHKPRTEPTQRQTQYDARVEDDEGGRRTPRRAHPTPVQPPPVRSAASTPGNRRAAESQPKAGRPAISELGYNEPSAVYVPCFKGALQRAEAPPQQPGSCAAKYPSTWSSETRSWCMVSRSRTVTALSSRVSKSTVTQNGVPISSWRR